MTKTIVANFVELLDRLGQPLDWFIREPVRDGEPLYYGLDEGYAGLAGTIAASQIIGAPMIICQFDDSDSIITIIEGREHEFGYCAIEDSFSISLVKKSVVFGAL